MLKQGVKFLPYSTVMHGGDSGQKTIRERKLDSSSQRLARHNYLKNSYLVKAVEQRLAGSKKTSLSGISSKPQFRILSKEKESPISPRQKYAARGVQKKPIMRTSLQLGSERELSEINGNSRALISHALKETREQAKLEGDDKRFIRQLAKQAMKLSPKIAWSLKEIVSCEIDRDKIEPFVNEFCRKIKSRWESKKAEVIKRSSSISKSKPIKIFPIPSKEKVLNFLNLIKLENWDSVFAYLKIFGKNIINECDYVRFIIKI